MSAFTTTDLIASIKARGSIPTSQNLFSEDDFLRFANEEMQSNIVPLILSVREEYFVNYEDVTLSSTQAEYRINKRAIGAKLRDVQFVTNNQTTYSLPRLNPEDISSNRSGVKGFYLRGNNIVINPLPNTGDVIRVSFYQRPGKLIPLAEAGLITSIDTVLNQIELDSVPSTFNTNIKVDFIRAQSGYECLSIDQLITGVSGTTITFSTLPSDLEVGDYLALAQESPIPQIPEELQSVLSQAVVVKLMEAMNDAQGMKSAQGKLDELKQAAINMISPRVDGEVQKITNPNSIISGYKRSFYRRGY